MNRNGGGGEEKKRENKGVKGEYKSVFAERIFRINK
jgi:hypothetical protein